MPEQKRRRAAVSLEGAQTADVNTGDSAGENIYHGLDGEQLRAIMQQQTEFYTTLVSAYERQYKDVVGQLDLLRREADIYQRGEKAQRQARQESLDASLAEFTEALTDQADALAELRRGQRLTRRWLVGLTLALLGAVLVVAVLAQRELTALAIVLLSP